MQHREAIYVWMKAEVIVLYAASSLRTVGRRCFSWSNGGGGQDEDERGHKKAQHHRSGSGSGSAAARHRHYVMWAEGGGGLAPAVLRPAATLSFQASSGQHHAYLLALLRCYSVPN